MATSSSEVVMILAILSALGQQLDLAAIAGLITVIGTGVDQLVIITDRLMRGATALDSKSEGKYAASGGRLHEKRIMEILGIIIGSAATTVAAMLPLPFMGFGALTGFAMTVIIGVIVGVGIARPAYASIADYILGEDEESETKALGGKANEASSKKSTRKESAKEGTGNQTAEEEEGNGKKAVKTRRKKGSRKDAEENSEE
jgi:preprotein translocase subunit SecD